MKRYLVYCAIACLAISVESHATAIANLALTLNVTCGIDANNPCPIGTYPNGQISLTTTPNQSNFYTNFASGNASAAVTTFQFGYPVVSVAATDTAYSVNNVGGIAISRGLLSGQFIMTNTTPYTARVPFDITATWNASAQTSAPGERASVFFGFDVTGYSETSDHIVLFHDSLIPDFRKSVSLHSIDGLYSQSDALAQNDGVYMPLAPNGIFYVTIDPIFEGVAVAPEPNSIALLVIGLAGFRLIAASRSVHKQGGCKIKQAE